MTTKGHQLDSGKLVAIKTFVQSVSSPITTSKRLKIIRKFFATVGSGSILTEDDHMLISKGLFYSIWASEMGKGCEDIICIIAEQANKDETILVTSFTSLALEWYGIDAIRIDKFSYFARILIRKAIDLEFSKHNRGMKLDGSVCVIDHILHAIRRSLGLLYHITEIFVEEMMRGFRLKLIWRYDEKGEIILHLVKPFIRVMLELEDERAVRTIHESIFDELENSVYKAESFYIKELLLEGFVNDLIVVASNEKLQRYSRKIIYSLVIKFRRQLQEIKFLSKSFEKMRRCKRSTKSLETVSKKLKLTGKHPYVVSVVPIPM